MLAGDVKPALSHWPRGLWGVFHLPPGVRSVASLGLHPLGSFSSTSLSETHGHAGSGAVSGSCFSADAA